MKGGFGSMRGGSARPSLLYRALGGAILLLTLLPLYRLLDDPATGSIGQGVLAATRSQTSFLWSAVIAAVAGVLLLTLLLPEGPLRRGMESLSRFLQKGSDRAFALGLGLAAAVSTGLKQLLVFQGRPNLIDGAAQLLHARYLASGHLAGPGREFLEGGFWYFPNTVATPQGWVSHYPPLHSVVLAPGMALGVPWLGPILLAGFTGWLVALLAFRLFPDRPLVARGGAALGALSPLLLMQTATYMNHGTAALLGAATLLAALRARTGSWPWSLAAGAGVTALLAVRPLTAVATCLVVVLLVWLPGIRERGGPWRWLSQRCAGATLGGLPLLLLHGWYNLRFFGHPTTFGYHWSYGEDTGLGLGIDPWGNRYGWTEALAFTSADLSALNLNLGQMPLPLVTLAGLALLLGMGAGWRSRLVAGWALLPVVLGVFYWHHGNFMGPRMLAEFAPAWGLLAALSLHFLLTRLPPSPRRVGQLLLVGAVASTLYLIPARVAQMEEVAGAYRAGLPPAGDQAIVFFSSNWSTRMNSDLISQGVPQVVMETAGRQNTTCTVQEYRAAFHRGEGPLAAYRGHPWGEGDIPQRHARGEFQAAGAFGPLPPLDLIRRPPPYGLETGHVGQGTEIRYVPEEPMAPGCVREIEADSRGGLTEAGYLAWLGGLPGGLEGDGPLFVRDMGPEINVRLLDRYPDKEALVWFRPEGEQEPILVPYPEGMARIWGGEGDP